MMLANKQFKEYLVTTGEEMFVSEKTHGNMNLRAFGDNIRTLPITSSNVRLTLYLDVVCVRCKDKCNLQRPFIYFSNYVARCPISSAP